MSEFLCAVKGVLYPKLLKYLFLVPNSKSPNTSCSIHTSSVTLWFKYRELGGTGFERGIGLTKHFKTEALSVKTYTKDCTSVSKVVPKLGSTYLKTSTKVFQTDPSKTRIYCI